MKLGMDMINRPYRKLDMPNFLTITAAKAPTERPFITQAKSPHNIQQNSAMIPDVVYVKVPAVKIFLAPFLFIVDCSVQGLLAGFKGIAAWLFAFNPGPRRAVML